MYISEQKVAHGFELCFTRQEPRNISLCGHVSRIFAFATICEFVYIHCTVEYMFHCIYPGINNTLLYSTFTSEIAPH